MKTASSPSIQGNCGTDHPDWAHFAVKEQNEPEPLSLDTATDFIEHVHTIGAKLDWLVFSLAQGQTNMNPGASFALLALLSSALLVSGCFHNADSDETGEVVIDWDSLSYQETEPQRALHTVAGRRVGLDPSLGDLSKDAKVRFDLDGDRRIVTLDGRFAGGPR